MPIIIGMTQKRHSIDQWIVLVLAFISLTLAASISRNVFERLPHLEDELAYLYQARVFADGEIVTDIPENSRAFWQPFVVSYWDSGHRFGKYTPGWPALLALGIHTGQMWVINGFFALLTVALTYRLGREIFDRLTGVIAAGLLTFSPMFLLQNGTLMAHSAALFFTLLFVYAYWRITRGKAARRWGVVAGVALGILVVIRPLTAAAISIPLILYSLLRLIQAGRPPEDRWPRLLATFTPLAILGVITLTLGSSVLLFNYAATDEIRLELYTEVWEYDRIGFGEAGEYGRSGHTIVKGVRHARFDLSLMAADLFGWVVERTDDGLILPANMQDMPDERIHHYLTSQNYYPAGLLGLSFFAVIAGLYVGFRRHAWLLGLTTVTLAWFVLPPLRDAAFLVDPAFTPLWLWLGGGIALILAPILILAFRQEAETARWTWLLFMVALMLILAHLAYWVGSQRYSTRYYHEGIAALSIIGALPFAYLGRQLVNRFDQRGYWLIGAPLVLILGYSLIAYSLPRIGVLYQFNRVAERVIERIEEQRDGDQPVLVIATLADDANLAWRGTGTLMGLTDPYFENDIIVAWNHMPGGNVRQSLIAQHPDRQVIDILIDFEDSWFPECGDELDDIPESCRINPPLPYRSEDN